MDGVVIVNEPNRTNGLLYMVDVVANPPEPTTIKFPIVGLISIRMLLATPETPAEMVLVEETLLVAGLR